MTTTPFDDHLAFDRRWGHPDSARWKQLADADPLLFIADHISSPDRREGSLAFAIQSDDAPSTLLVLRDGPTRPTDNDCLTALGSAVERSPSSIRSLGIVHHRHGGLGVTDLDRRWALALRAICLAFDLEPLGVMARLYGGELVRIEIPSVLPEDYLSAIGR